MKSYKPLIYFTGNCDMISNRRMHYNNGSIIAYTYQRHVELLRNFYEREWRNKYSKSKAANK